MANLNKVLLIGNLTRDPELRYLPPSQTPVCDFGLATNRTWTGQDGVKKEEVTFVDCSCFGKIAEILAKYKKKGDPLFVEGRLKLDQWERDGTKHYKMKVVVENFQFLNRGQGGGYGAPAENSEYAGEPGQGGGGYAPRQQARPAYNRGGGRPVAAAQAAPPAQSAPDYDTGDPVPEDSAPPIKDEDIPF
jgi:single-strand DNA-binding protein